MRTVTIAVLVGALALAGCSGDEGAATERTSPAPPTADAPGGCGGDGSVEPGTERLRVDHGGTTREVERTIPPAYDDEQALPVIVNLHGFTSDIEQQNLFSGLPERAAERGFVLLTPQAADATLAVDGQEITAPFWNVRPDETDGTPGVQDDVGFLTQLVDATIDQLCVDPARVYVTGNSNGAGMAAALACALPGRLAAIAPVSGVNLAPPCPDLQPVSVAAFHGDADPLVPYAGEATAGTGSTNPPVEDAVGAFAEAAGCAAEPEVEELVDDVTLRRWTDCRPGFDVRLHTVLGGGHTWPGMLNYVDVERLQQLAQGLELPRAAGVDVAAIAGHMTTDIEATTVMLDFFDAHRLDEG